MSNTGHDSYDPINDIDFTRIWICKQCCELAGPWSYRSEAVSYRQKCRCERSAEPDEERWPRFDFNKIFELCNCCGAELLRSGSKFSIWFCDQCKEYVRQLHARTGRYLIPIGRHSFMSGFGVGTPTIALPARLSEIQSEHIERFVRRFRSAFDKMKRLIEWSRMGVKHNLIEMSLFGPETVMLTEYLAALKAYNRTKEDAFHEMCTFFELTGDSNDKEKLNLVDKPRHS